MKKQILTCPILFAVFFITAASISLPAHSEPELPTIDEITVSQEPMFGTQPPTLSEKNRALGWKCIELAHGYSMEHRQRDALIAYQRAANLLGNGFPCYIELGIAFGDMGEWSSALAVFRRHMRAAHSYDDVERIVQYLLAHQRKEAALELSSDGGNDAQTSKFFLLRSKVLELNHRTGEAIRIANLAYYLDSMYGLDRSKSRAMLEELGVTPNEEVKPNQIDSEKFWKLIDAVIARKHPVEPNELRGMIGQVGMLNAYGNIRGVRFPLGYNSPKFLGPFKSIGVAEPGFVKGSMFSVQPNIFTCCLTDNDVRAHFKEALKSGQSGGLGGDESTPDPINLQCSRPEGSIMFSFSSQGLHPLNSLSITWNESYKSNFKMPEPPVVHSYINEAMSAFSAGKFAKARHSLCLAIAAMSDKQKYHSNSRFEYEEIKELLHRLYLQQGKSAIAQYCQQASYVEL